ncbi:hypothetical protein [Nocardioides jejuensis]|uniref:SurA N-terminal domain-containing protein n=1 Tax=Nocardioides jejuensis TaxID=2502782 RepID=A0A4R1CBX3_9ACTN|nr:hypothetical protein [Nocardioides jejuensis]TCJ28613.1 hypothetical protein EPD65_07855 [Nocardioides jejuensis]
MTHVRRVALAALALAAVSATSACSGGPALHPGDAAVVDGHAIRLTTVDDLAADFCTLEEPGLAQQGAVLPMALLRSAAAETLVTDALLPAFAKEVGIDMATVRDGVRKEAAKQAATLPEDIRSVATARLELEGARQAVLQLVGQAGAQSPDQAVALGAQLFKAWRAKQHIDLDPRFGAVDLDALQWDGANGSLSVPADDAAAPLDQKAAAALPADQRCGSVAG